MHELGIAESALRAVLEVARKGKAVQVRRVVVRIGARSGVEPEAFRFAFDALRVDTRAAGAAVDVECIPATGRCEECGACFAVSDFPAGGCPACGGARVDVAGGMELELKTVDLV